MNSERVIGWCSFSVEGQPVEYRLVVQSDSYQYTVPAKLEEIKGLPEIKSF